MKYSTPARNVHLQSETFSHEKSWSKKVTKRRRRSAAKDRKALDIVGKTTPPFVSAPDASSVATPIPANDDNPSSTTHPKKRGAHHGWEHTTDVGKAITANRVIAATGQGYAFTLNLGPKEIEAANDNKKGFTDYFKRRISRALRGVLPMPLYWFAIGVTATGRPHIHGSIAVNDNQKLEGVERALKHAAGEWAHKHGKDRQCDLQPLDRTPDVWADYCLRQAATARRVMGQKTVSITTPLRRAARGLWLASEVVGYRTLRMHPVRMDLMLP